MKTENTKISFTVPIHIFGTSQFRVTVPNVDTERFQSDLAYRAEIISLAKELAQELANEEDFGILCDIDYDVNEPIDMTYTVHQVLN